MGPRHIFFVVAQIKKAFCHVISFSFFIFDFIKLDSNHYEVKEPLGTHATAFIDVSQCWETQPVPAPLIASWALQGDSPDQLLSISDKIKGQKN